MNTKKPNSALGAEVERAIQKHAAARSEWEKDKRPPHPGDLLHVAGLEDGGIRWAPIFRHPDDASLLYVVPADDVPLLGTQDVGVPEDAPCGPLALRCGCGSWLAESAVAEGRLRVGRVGRLDDRHVRRAHRKIAQLTAGRTESVPDQHEVDSDPEYQEWMEHVERSSDELQRLVDGELVIDQPVPIGADFARSSPLAGLRLAAAGRSLVQEARDLVRDEAAKVQGQVIRCAGGVELSAERNRTGVRLRIGSGPNARPPRTKALGADGRWRALRWRKTGHGRDAGSSTEVISWHEGEVRFAIQGEPVLEVRIRR